VPSAVAVWAYASTDKEGNYVVGELPAGEYLVAASAQVGWEYVQRWYRDAATVEEAEPILLAEHQRAEGIDVALPVQVGTASLSGVVRDSNGVPLAWASVEVTPIPSSTDPDRSSRFYAYAQTDSLGAYRVDRLPAGDYQVHASYGTGDRYGHGWYQGASTPEAATPVSLSDEANRTDVDFSLVVRPLYGVVAGSVTDAATGAPLVRAYVELAPVGRDVLLAAPFRWSVNHAITDDAGRYEMTWIPEGEYSLTVYANGGGTGSTGQADLASFAVVGGETVFRDLALPLRYDGDGVISGTVTMDYSRTGPLLETAAVPAVDQDIAISPDSRIAYPGNLEVAVVLAYPVSAGAAAAELPYTAVTAADGTYSLRGLAPGEYAVMCFAPGSIGIYYGGTYAPEKSELVHVDGTEPTAGIDFALAPVYYWRLAADGAEGGVVAPTAGDKDASAAGNSSSAVYGKVTDESGNAVAGATVYLLDETEQPTAYSQTGPDGSFELNNVVPGGYRVYASKLGVGGAYNGNNQNFAAAEPLAVNGGYLEVNLVLSSGSSTAVEEEEGETLPRAFTLNRCYPNPFNPSTLIGFSVATSGPATLRVYNSLGQEVAVLFNDRAEAGRAYELSFRAEALSAGTYLYTLEAGGQRLSRAMSLVK
ncbi:MAG: carboxypeptidase regulatory-like domain-containing protein, partial [Candidatus Latescibacterota bacterium]|jgi:protocatechuate 3,4-dioxygenase beta subunit